MAIRNLSPGPILPRERRVLRTICARRRVADAKYSASWCRGARSTISTSSNRCSRQNGSSRSRSRSETSTGVITDVRTVAELAHRYGAICIVDSVSGAGGAEITVDGWEIDFCLTGSQKALALPAGLAFAVASAEFVERAKSVQNRGFYFDIVEYENYAQKNQTPSTPATHLLYALEAQMGDIGREGIERRWDRHISMRDATIDWVYGCRAAVSS